MFQKGSDSMKRTICFVLVMVLVLAFSGCGDREPEKATGPTGTNGQVEQPQIWYNGGLYLYYATGFDENLPEGYDLVGQVKCVDNGKQPTEEFCACQLEAGQNVYANTEDPEHIYVEYDNGCAVFTLKDETQ